MRICSSASTEHVYDTRRKQSPQPKGHVSVITALFVSIMPKLPLSQILKTHRGTSESSDRRVYFQRATSIIYSQLSRKR